MPELVPEPEDVVPEPLAELGVADGELEPELVEPEPLVELSVEETVPLPEPDPEPVVTLPSELVVEPLVLDPLASELPEPLVVPLESLPDPSTEPLPDGGVDPLLVELPVLDVPLSELP